MTTCSKTPTEVKDLTAGEVIVCSRYVDGCVEPAGHDGDHVWPSLDGQHALHATSGGKLIAVSGEAASWR